MPDDFSGSNRLRGRLNHLFYFLYVSVQFAGANCRARPREPYKPNEKTKFRLGFFMPDDFSGSNRLRGRLTHLFYFLYVSVQFASANCRARPVEQYFF